MAWFRVVTPRRGVPVSVVVTAAGTAGLVGRWQEWLGVWSQTHTYLNVGLILFLPAVGGAAAWIGTGNKRGGLDSMASLASRNQWRVHARGLIETLIWLLAGFAAVAIPAMLLTAQSASYGNVQWASLLSDFAILSSVTAIGLVAGRNIPWVIAAPVMTVLTYAVLALLPTAAEDIAAAITPLDGRSFTFHTVPLWIYWTQIMVWTLVTAAVVIHNMGRSKHALLTLWLAGVFSAPLLYVGLADRRVDYGAAAMGCDPRADNMVVCLPQVKSYLGPEIAAYLVEVRRLLQGLIAEPAAYIDSETRALSREANRSVRATIRTQLNAGQSIITFSQLRVDLSAYTQIDRETFLSDVARALFGTSRSTTSSNSVDVKTQAAPNDVLMRWLLESLDVPIDGSAGPGAPVIDGSLFSFDNAVEPLQWLRGLSAMEREDWFRSHREDILDGKLDFSDFR